jgi:hypothetical protein
MFLSRFLLVFLQGLVVAILEDEDDELSIGMPWIAAAVAAFELLMKAVLPILLLNPVPSLELIGDTIALNVHIRCDVMSYLPIGMAKAYASIEGRRPEPERPIIFSLGRAPEPDMMPLSRAVSDRLLES